MIFSGIINGVVHYNNNQDKYESSTTDLNNINFENNFDASIVSTGIEENYVNSDYKYSDINNQWQNLTL